MSADLIANNATLIAEAYSTEARALHDAGRVDLAVYATLIEAGLLADVDPLRAQAAERTAALMANRHMLHVSDEARDRRAERRGEPQPNETEFERLTRGAFRVGFVAAEVVS